VTTKKKLSPGEERRRKRDTRVAALSISQIPKENQRSTRSLNQALLAGEPHDAIILCLKDNKLMPLATLLRSLIDTCVLGIWFLKHAKDEEITESVAHLGFQRAGKGAQEHSKIVFASIPQDRWMRNADWMKLVEKLWFGMRPHLVPFSGHQVLGRVGRS
jgi:hypothetical protein